MPLLGLGQCTDMQWPLHATVGMARQESCAGLSWLCRYCVRYTTKQNLCFFKKLVNCTKCSQFQTLKYKNFILELSIEGNTVVQQTAFLLIVYFDPTFLTLQSLTWKQNHENRRYGKFWQQAALKHEVS